MWVQLTFSEKKVSYEVKKNQKFQKDKKKLLSQIKISVDSLSWIKRLLERSSRIIQDSIKKQEFADNGSIYFNGELTSLASLEKKINTLINKSNYEKKIFLDLYTKYEKLKKQNRKNDF